MTPIVVFNFFQTFCINVSARVCAYIYVCTKFMLFGIRDVYDHYVQIFYFQFLQDMFLTALADFLQYEWYKHI